MMTVLEKMGFFECSVVLLGSRVESGSGVVAETTTPLPPLSLSKIQLSYLHQKEQQAHKPIAREIKILIEMHISGYPNRSTGCVFNGLDLLHHTIQSTWV